MARIGNKLLERRLTAGGVGEAYEAGKMATRKPSKAGGYNEIYNFGSPKARWRSQIFKYGPLKVVPGEQVLNFSSSIATGAARSTNIEVKRITLFVSGALSSSCFVDKVGIKGRALDLAADADYFYTGSTSHQGPGIGHYVSGAGDALIAGQARAGQQGVGGNYNSAHLYSGGWFTGSCDITVTLNKVPLAKLASEPSASFYLYVYADKYWRAWE